MIKLFPFGVVGALVALAACASRPQPLAHGHPATDCASFLTGAWGFQPIGYAATLPEGQGLASSWSAQLVLDADGRYALAETTYASSLPQVAERSGRWSVREGRDRRHCVVALDQAQDARLAGEYEIVSLAEIRKGALRAGRAGRFAIETAPP